MTKMTFSHSQKKTSKLIFFPLHSKNFGIRRILPTVEKKNDPTLKNRFPMRVRHVKAQSISASLLSILNVKHKRVNFWVCRCHDSEAARHIMKSWIQTLNSFKISVIEKAQKQKKSSGESGVV